MINQFFRRLCVQYQFGFIKIIVSACFIVFSSFHPHETKRNSDEVMAFFSDIRSYIISDLGISLNESFYSDRMEGYQYYLYVSESDEIRLPEGEGNFRYFGSQVKKADSTQRALNKKGYHTLLYRTAATSAARVQSPLYQYPMHCLSFIALHEAHHIHRRNNPDHKIPYSLEEASGDVLGNYVSLDYARKFPSKLDSNLVKEQIQLNEEIYQRLNDTRIALDKRAFDRLKCRRFSRFLEKKLANSDSFKRDRFLYPVNNAYFIRYGYYTTHYFLLRDLYFKTGGAKNFLSFLDTLPSTEVEAVNRIKEFLQS